MKAATLGMVTVVLPRAVLARIEWPNVGLAAGSLLGGAFLHIAPFGEVQLPRPTDRPKRLNILGYEQPR